MKQNNSHIPQNLKLLGAIIPVLCIVAAFALNIAYRESLFLMGVNKIYWMHSYATSALITFQNLFSTLAHPIIIVIILVFQLLVVKQRVRSLVHIIFVTSGLYLTFLFKQFFQETRPFWYSQKISTLDWFCQSDFGNPSGHSFGVIVLYEPLLSDVLGSGYKKVLIWLWFVVASLVMVSRMYLGSHSLDQIIFGGLIGLAWLVFYRFKLRQFLHDTISKLLAQRQKIYFAVCTTVLFLICLTLPIVVYLANLDSRPVDINDLNNINLKCNKSVTSQDLKSKSLRDSAMGFIALGLMYGIIMLKNQQRRDTFYFVGLWSFKSPKQIAFWVLAILIVVGIPTAFFALLLPVLVKVPIFKFVSTAIGTTYGGFAFVFLISQVQNKYAWIEYRQSLGQQDKIKHVYQEIQSN